MSTNLVKDQDTLPVNRYLIHRQTFPMFKNLCKIYETENEYSKYLHRTCETAGRLPLLDKNLSLSANLIAVHCITYNKQETPMMLCNCNFAECSVFFTWQYVAPKIIVQAPKTSTAPTHLDAPVFRRIVSTSNFAWRPICNRESHPG